uniref:Uncharacterized protein n=1 Tax=Arundo donax TaxID=35708 RepID=A0A0A9GSM3_ARUDO
MLLFLAPVPWSHQFEKQLGPFNSLSRPRPRRRPGAPVTALRCTGGGTGPVAEWCV